jgi:hypothetical protein
MSEKGHFRKSGPVTGMSVIASGADIVGPPGHVRFVPNPDVRTVQRSPRTPTSLGGQTNRTTMSPSSNISIAKKARTKAEADFATWLMMAKLGGFDDLPSNAQSFLSKVRGKNFSTPRVAGSKSSRCSR